MRAAGQNLKRLLKNAAGDAGLCQQRRCVPFFGSFSSMYPAPFLAEQPFLLLIYSGEARVEQQCVAFTDEIYESIFNRLVHSATYLFIK